MIHLLHQVCHELYLDILRCYYQQEALNIDDISRINPADDRKFMPLNQLY